MSRRANFLETDDSTREQNLRFVRTPEDDLQQFFGGSSDGNVVAPPRDSKIVTPRPDNSYNQREMEDRKEFFRQLGLPRHEVYEWAKRTFDINGFEIKHFQDRRHMLRSQRISQAKTDELVLQAIKDLYRNATVIDTGKARSSSRSERVNSSQHRSESRHHSRSHSQRSHSQRSHSRRSHSQRSHSRSHRRSRCRSQQRLSNQCRRSSSPPEPPIIENWHVYQTANNEIQDYRFTERRSHSRSPLRHDFDSAGENNDFRHSMEARLDSSLEDSMRGKLIEDNYINQQARKMQRFNSSPPRQNWQNEPMENWQSQRNPPSLESLEKAKERLFQEHQKNRRNNDNDSDRKQGFGHFKEKQQFNRSNFDNNSRSFNNAPTQQGFQQQQQTQQSFRQQPQNQFVQQFNHGSQRYRETPEQFNQGSQRYENSQQERPVQFTQQTSGFNQGSERLQNTQQQASGHFNQGPQRFRNTQQQAPEQFNQGSQRYGNTQQQTPEQFNQASQRYGNTQQQSPEQCNQGSQRFRNTQQQSPEQFNQGSQRFRNTQQQAPEQYNQRSQRYGNTQQQAPEQYNQRSQRYGNTQQQAPEQINQGPRNRPTQSPADLHQTPTNNFPNSRNQQQNQNFEQGFNRHQNNFSGPQQRPQNSMQQFSENNFNAGPSSQRFQPSPQQFNRGRRTDSTEQQMQNQRFQQNNQSVESSTASRSQSGPMNTFNAIQQNNNGQRGQQFDQPPNRPQQKNPPVQWRLQSNQGPINSQQLNQNFDQQGPSTSTKWSENNSRNQFDSQAQNNQDNQPQQRSQTASRPQSTKKVRPISQQFKRCQDKVEAGELLTTSQERLLRRKQALPRTKRTEFNVEDFGDILPLQEDHAANSRYHWMQWWQQNNWVQQAIIKVSDNDPEMLAQLSMDDGPSIGMKSRNPKKLATNHLKTCENIIVSSMNNFKHSGNITNAYGFLKSVLYLNETRPFEATKPGRRIIVHLNKMLNKANFLPYFKGVIEIWKSAYEAANNSRLLDKSMPTRALRDKVLNYLVQLAFREIKLITDPIINPKSKSEQLKELYIYVARLKPNFDFNATLKNQHFKNDFSGDPDTSLVNKIKLLKHTIENPKTELTFKVCFQITVSHLQLMDKKWDRFIDADLKKQKNDFLAEIEKISALDTYYDFLCYKLIKVRDRIMYLNAIHRRFLRFRDKREKRTLREFAKRKDVHYICKYILQERMSKGIMDKVMLPHEHVVEEHDDYESNDDFDYDDDDVDIDEDNDDDEENYEGEEDNFEDEDDDEGGIDGICIYVDDDEEL